MTVRYHRLLREDISHGLHFIAAPVVLAYCLGFIAQQFLNLGLFEQYGISIGRVVRHNNRAVGGRYAPRHVHHLDLRLRLVYRRGQCGRVISRLIRIQARLVSGEGISTVVLNVAQPIRVSIAPSSWSIRPRIA